MKFILDQSVERRLSSFLRNLGHDVKVVSVDYKAGILDQEVLTHAYNESRILLTNDKGDFGELIFRHHHPHSGVILFRRMRSGDLLTKQQRLSFVLKAYAGKLHHFLVVTPTSVRVRKTHNSRKAA
jgi:predicted nuclease of predicted toxin-antitoxin system